MPRFEPFRAVRYAAGTDLSLVVAPPYDVLSPAEVDELRGRDGHNIVHVDVPEGGAGRYDEAAARLRRWLVEGVLVADEQPTFTLYRMRFTDATGADRELVGVLGGLEIVDEGGDGVLPHERTTPKASTDRLDLTRATEANLSPVWGLSLAAGLTASLEEPGEAVGSVVVDGVEHAVERVGGQDRIDDIRGRLATAAVLIADGHHRYGISRTYRDEVRAATGRSDTPAELTLAFVGELTPEQLSIEAIHRLYRGPSADQLGEVLAERFESAPAPPPSPDLLAEMNRRGALVLVRPDGSAEWLTPRPGAFEGVRSLDGAWLEAALAAVPVDVEYQHGLDEVIDALRTDRAGAAVLIRPVGIAEIERTAREGLLMPPKSTFFTPKLRTGFVVRDLTTG